jgi:hypothetical protein
LTTRALPNRSFDAACRHLFRHLREPAELRRNPLVSAYFSHELKGVARIRADAALAGAIRDAVCRHAELCLQSDRLEDEERAWQRYEVIHADVDGIPRGLLAAKLGLSARQYTRLQHGIRRRIAVLLSSEIQHEVRARTTPDRACSPLSEVVALASKGSTAGALARLSAITASGDDSLTASALCLLALIRQRYMGDFAGANDALAASRSILEKVDATEPSRPLIHAEIELALIEMDVHLGRFDRATEGSTAIAHTLAQTNDAARWLRLRALSIAAYGHLVMGKHNESLSCLRSLLPDLRAAKFAAAPERVELTLEAAIVLFELGRFSDSSRMLADAWLVARQGKLDLDMVRLDLSHATLALECGAVSMAIERLSDICEQSRRLGSPSLCARAHTYLARAQMRASHPRPMAILDNARRAIDLSRAQTSDWIGAKVAESFAKLMLRKVAEAERAARAADDAAVATGNRVFRGSTLRELARVAHVQGRPRDAKRAIMAAIEAGYAVGKPQQTAQALDLAAQILRQPNYRNEATAIRAAVALSGPQSLTIGSGG